MQRGKLVILFILCIGTLAAIISIWTHYRGGQRALKYLGKHDALLLRDAKTVRLMRLKPAESDEVKEGDSWNVEGGQWAVEQQFDVTHRSGVLYIREALLHDSTFDWAAQPKDCQSKQLFVLVFQSDKDQLKLIFDTQCQWMRAEGNSRPAISIAPTITFFSDWLTHQLPPN